VGLRISTKVAISFLMERSSLASRETVWRTMLSNGGSEEGIVPVAGHAAIFSNWIMRAARSYKMACLVVHNVKGTN
jgi:hypothetical protein